MRTDRFILCFILLVIAQILVCNFLNLSQYLMLTILPVLILSIPSTVRTPWIILIAFATGFAVDFVSTGALGLTSAALLPVALLRNTVIELVYGEDLFLRKEDISAARHGNFKMSTAIVLCLLLFLIVFIFLDSAGTRPFWFNALKCLVSLAASFLCSLPLCRMMCP